MLNDDQLRDHNPLTMPFVIVMILAIGFGVFGVWAFTNYNNEKNNVDLIVSEEVVKAEVAKEEELRAELDEQMKDPNKTYTSASALGSVKIVYPRTWSAYIQEQETGAVRLEGYFHPDYVPSIDSRSLYATRVNLSNTEYKRTLDTYQRQVENGDLRAKAITISGAKGTRLDGEISRDVHGAIVLLPLRDKTLKIWTESNDYMKDFNKIISNLTYSP